jgi:AcrR family transcriptional regulator
MRYPADQKAKAREAILQAGAKALRTNGFNGIGVDGLAAAASVTSGAFYSNFSNKETHSSTLKTVVSLNGRNAFGTIWKCILAAVTGPILRTDV